MLVSTPSQCLGKDRNIFSRRSKRWKVTRARSSQWWLDLQRYFSQPWSPADVTAAKFSKKYSVRCIACYPEPQAREALRAARWDPEAQTPSHGSRHCSPHKCCRLEYLVEWLHRCCLVLLVRFLEGLQQLFLYAASADRAEKGGEKGLT